MVGSKALSQEQFRTTICHIEAIVNSRPLIQLSDDIDDDNVLSPSHFIVGQSLMRLPSDTPNDSVDKEIKTLWKGRNDILSMFWKTWNQKYLRQLRIHTTKSGNLLKEGDVVLVNNEKQRHRWPLAVVKRLLPSKDSRVRTVEVKMQGKLFIRPVQRLYLLEASSESTV